jgi:hypothetical protein
MALTADALIAELTKHQEDSKNAVKKEDAVLRVSATPKGEELLAAWLTTNKDNIDKAIAKAKEPRRATAFNDLYKWTMMPVIRKLESYYNYNVKVTFGIDIRDSGLRAALKTETGDALRNKVSAALTELTKRKFDKAML